jgi:hypothetical protein
MSLALSCQCLRVCLAYSRMLPALAVAGALGICSVAAFAAYFRTPGSECSCCFDFSGALALPPGA